jgi:hypothetical protein
MHCTQAVLPSITVVLPGAQSVQVAALTCLIDSEYLPTAQLVQAEAPAYLPNTSISIK